MQPNTAAPAVADVQDFETDVLEASYAQPVLVDFWAPWCGPCRVLGPVLERLATEEADGRWRLVKVNTDAHPQLSTQYGIRGIPAVKLFVDGKVVDEFTGALPDYAIRQWLDKALPSETRRQVERAEALLAAGEAEEAEAVLNDVLALTPDDPKARLLLAQLIVFRDPARAAQLAEGAAFAGPVYVQIGEAVQTLAGLLQAPPAELPEGAGRAAYRAALDALARRDFDVAAGHLVEVLRTDRYYHDDAARRVGIALFTLLGPQHDVTRRHRRAFDMWLY